MSIIADRGLFVRLLMQSGKFESAAAEALVDALDAGTRESATRVDLLEVRNELKLDLSELRSELKSDIAELRSELKVEIAELRTELKAEIAELRTEMRLEFAAVRKEIAELRKDMEAQTNKLLLSIGGMLVVGVGVIFAALRLPH